MPRTQQIKQYNTFIKGLVTEASPLTFPENSSSDEENFVLRHDGSRRRRRGIDYATTASITFTTNDAITEHEWRTVSGDADVNFIVIQVGSTLHYFLDSDDDPTNNKKSFTTALTSYKVSGATDAQVAQNPVSISYGRGYLFVVGKYIKPFYVTYTAGTDTISHSLITVEERDFEGASDGLGIDENPSWATAAHLYNLKNQGWEDSYINSYVASEGEYPSNAQIWVYGKYVNVSSGAETFSVAELLKQSFGNTRAPMGHYIRNVFDTTQAYTFTQTSTISSFTYLAGVVSITTTTSHGLTTGDTVIITGDSFNYDSGTGCPGTNSSLNGTYTITKLNSTSFSVNKTLTGYVSTCSHADKGTVTFTVSNPSGVTETYRPEVTAFFAGRVWYAGCSSNRIGSNIYFSQLAKYPNQFGRCYQEADPTSEHISDIVDTDGGYVVIPDMGQVLKLLPISTSLVVFASNGVWMISGSSEESFTATSYSVRRLLEVPMTAKFSVVNVEGTPLFWADSGIYALQQDKITGYLSAQNISVGTIQSLFTAIPKANHAYVKAVYNAASKVVNWLYNDTTAGYAYNKILMMDVPIQAFYKYSVSATAPKIVGASVVSSTVDEEKRVRYLTQVSPTTGTFAAFTNTNFMDWYTYDSTGVNYSSYLTTGQELLGDFVRNKEIPFLFMMFKRTEDGYALDGNGNIELAHRSGCLVQARWEWADSDNSGRWGTQFQAYRLGRVYIPSSVSDTFDYGFDVVVTKNKLRGKGRAISLNIQSEQGKDMWLLGWSIPYSVSTVP